MTGAPIGAVPTVDHWGNQTFQGIGPTAGVTYYDTSKGCPIGMMSWRDNWGNPVCRRF